jgi:hypothetical protein
VRLNLSAFKLLKEKKVTQQKNPTQASNSLQGIETWFKAFMTSAEEFFDNAAWPFIKTFFLSLVESELTMLAPHAAQAVQKVETELGLLFASPGDFIKFFNAAVVELWQIVESNGLSVAEQAMVNAGLAAIANLLASSKRAA